MTGAVRNLVAYALTRHDWRRCRLDRLQRPVGTGARFLAWELPVADAAEFVRPGIGAGRRRTSWRS